MKRNSQAITSQSLGSLLKSTRDITRKDKGLNGDLDRLPMFTWIKHILEHVRNTFQNTLETHKNAHETRKTH